MAVTFLLPSGCPTGLVTVSGLTVGNTFDGSHLGFFGTGGPGNSVAVGSYQDETYRTDAGGSNRGQGLNWKFISSTTAQHSGVTRTLPVLAPSSTIIIRLTTGSDVQTQNGRLYAVAFNASSGALWGEAPDNITTQLAESNRSSSWTDASSDGSNFLSLTNQAWTTSQHDFHVMVSLKPLTTGVKNLFGFLCSVEHF